MVTLRFVAGSTETWFLGKRAERIPHALLLVGATVFCITTISLLSSCYLVLRGAADLNDKVFIACKLVDAWLGIWALLAITLAVYQIRAQSVSPLFFEIGCAAATIVLAMICICRDGYFTIHMLGLDDPANLVGDAAYADKWLILCTEIVVVVSHIVLPVRWFVLLPVDLTCVLLYAASIAISGRMRNSEQSIATVLGIFFMAIMGSRSKEKQERQTFWAYLEQKTLRVQSEFRIAQLESDLNCIEGGMSANIRQDEDMSEGSLDMQSLPSTTPTGRIFEVDATDVHLKLDNMTRIGTKEKWLLASKDVRIYSRDVLGSGGFGVVVKGDLHGTKVALKVPRQSSQNKSANHLLELANELRILRQVRHPNIVLFFGAVIDTELMHLVLVLELVDGSPLDAYIACSTLPSISEQHKIIMGVCSALQFLHVHTPVLVHGDLKSSNILVQEGGHAKLLDFGLARVITRRARPLGGTIRWMAPEVFNHRVSTKKSSGTAADVFSFGCVMHFIATGNVTQHGTSRRAMMHTIRTGRLPPLSWPNSTPFVLECKAVVERCTEVDANSRISISEVMEDLQDWPSRIRFPDSRTWRKKDKENVLEEWNAGLEKVHQWAAKKSGLRGGLSRARKSILSRKRSSDREDSEKPAADVVETLEVEPRVPLEFHDPNTSLSSVPEVAENRNGTPECTHQGSNPEAAVTATASGGRNMTPEPTANPSGLMNQTGAESAQASQDEGRPKYKPTPMATQRLMLTEVMLRWYPEHTRANCCTYHAVLEGLDHLCRKLRKMPCKPKFCLGNGAQCPKCGALDAADDSGEGDAMNECDVCGHTYRQAAKEPDRDRRGTWARGEGGASSSGRVAL